ncbi:hypothetical protein HanXRQr2_Chr03g0106901 [Helianthus annuus]|uniref:Uncharacterized protein n=1 Tax=Helianthus annuus TaxID=4232 RepID=A0A251V694_HELAN|nr:hypothetical protein HanXRQr2_Chr03g0106901 [Helianthus annuus]KAJ0600445.1 hypothetical protein HanIR_Chr03g0116671 [Helianthus annuus]KAJ0943370.1 hypothetical protein HanPSC8_Chr03g0103411 [Helianthus annuus]
MLSPSLTLICALAKVTKLPQKFSGALGTSTFLKLTTWLTKDTFDSPFALSMSTKAFHNSATISCTFEGLCFILLSSLMTFSLNFVIAYPLNENTRITELFTEGDLSKASSVSC